ncbi:hypothetical protein [uncultured Ferrimonas sp.]|uniref:hypothetical protein n=1 Tax=uncultured Ferrimonas sp. TaxID=432640 RepID=UPI002605BF04|nr:hypothetical protein [uncultured Ferrimonas sp.]
MFRHFYLCTSLWELDLIERELQQVGLRPSQIHVLSAQPQLADRFHLNPLNEFWYYNLPRSLAAGTVIGAAVAGLVLAAADIGGLAIQIGSWVPIGMLALLLGLFCAWQGGFIGLQCPHHQLGRYQQAVRSGMHLLLVDVSFTERPRLQQVMSNHPLVLHDGCRIASDRYFMQLQDLWH